MHRNCCCAAVRMPEAFMGTALPNFLEPERGKDGDGLARLKSWDARHPFLCQGDRLRTHILGCQDRRVLLKE